MSLPPPDPPTGRSANPARIMLNSPLAAATRARVYHQRTRQRPRESGLRVIAAVGALLVHLLCLFAFVLGPAYEVKLPPEPPRQFLQVRLIEPPEPPPPPPVRGTPPKEKGPRHQGRSSRAASVSERSANVEATEAARPIPAAAPPVIAKARRPRAAPKPRPVAAPLPPVSLPQPAPTPELQPVPLAGEPPTVSLPTPSLQPPVPPKFQPESVRKPQLEGNQPMLPPASLALPEVPSQAPPPVAVSSIALSTELPTSSAPASVTPVRAQLPAAPPVPELQPIPLPAQPSPSVNLQAQVSAPAPSVPNQKPQVQAPAIDVAEAELEAVPLTPAAPAPVTPTAPTVKIDVAEATSKTAVQPSIARPQLDAPVALAPVAETAPAPTGSQAQVPSSATTQSPVAPQNSSANVEAGRDVSRAPNATPQGSDNAIPGEPDGVASAPENAGSNAAAAQPAAGKGSDKGAGKQQGIGQPGGNRPGADQGSLAAGAPQGQVGSYVQLKPRGDTQIMGHGTPNIGYRPTRFEQDWAPEGESSIDTALRHAVEKTTVKHTFHLPRGVRVECAVMPLLPMSLLGCRNPDPPPKPVDAAVYERLNLAPAKPLAPPAPAESAAPAPMVKIDHSAECAVARVAGSPPPPGCESIVLPLKPAGPASSASSWVPASDQFH